MAGSQLINFPYNYDDLPSPAPTDYEDIVKHSQQHTQANQGVMAVQKRVGKLGETDPASLTGELEAHKNDITEHASGRLLGSAEPASSVVVTGGTYAGGNVPNTPVAIPAMTLNVRIGVRPFFLVLDVDAYNNDATAGGELQYLGIKDITSGVAATLFPDRWKNVPVTASMGGIHLEWGPFVAPAGDRIYRMYWTHTNSARTFTMNVLTPNVLLPPMGLTFYAREA